MGKVKMPKTRAEIDRAAYLKRTADKPRYYCTQCDRQLRSDSPLTICRACWLKTDEGKEYLRLKQAESRAKNKAEKC
jgi:transposase-like protein